MPTTRLPEKENIMTTTSVKYPMVRYRVFFDPDQGPGVFSIGSRVTIPEDVPTGDDPKDGWYLFLSSPNVEHIRRWLRPDRLRTG